MEEGDFRLILDSFNIGEWAVPIMGLLILGISLILLFVLSKLFSKIIGKRLRVKGISPDMYNGIKFFLKIFIAFGIVILSTYLLNIDKKYVALISGIVGTAISFASMKAINNFIAGVWITLTTPFQVGDYVKIGSKEGLIIEISLNYTKLMYQDKNITMIPNIECLKTNIVNYTISTTWFADEIFKLESQIQNTKEDKIKHDDDVLNFKHLKQKLERMKKNYEQITEVQNAIDKKGSNLNKKHSKYVDEDKIVRYTFNVALQRTPSKNSKHLEEICEKWAKEFEIQPKFKILGIDSHINYYFIIITPDPMDIIDYMDDFYEDIYKKLYSD
ncbi:MAG: mechanosensitive ion channel domain-containing protein [Promethearchaeota archaeon]